MKKIIASLMLCAIGSMAIAAEPTDSHLVVDYSWWDGTTSMKAAVSTNLVFAHCMDGVNQIAGDAFDYVTIISPNTFELVYKEGSIVVSGAVCKFIATAPQDVEKRKTGLNTNFYRTLQKLNGGNTY